MAAGFDFQFRGTLEEVKPIHIQEYKIQIDGFQVVALQVNTIYI